MGLFSRNKSKKATVEEPKKEEGMKNSMKILVEKGDRSIGVIGWEQGDATWLGRYEGYQKGIEE